jgi:hypothetical protein
VEEERHEYIVYLETDVTITARSLGEAKRLAKELIDATSRNTHIARIDDTRIITGEKIGHFKPHKPAPRKINHAKL